MYKRNLKRGRASVPTVTALVFVPILAVACFFFAIKFYELVVVPTYDANGVFAVTPIVNYLLAGLGFLCLLGWAAHNGMFHDIEQPKCTMLDNELRLDENSEPYMKWNPTQDRS